ncbi:MAG: hypothetical protein WBG86_14110, partial [Polyangiales bacterium]
RFATHMAKYARLHPTAVLPIPCARPTSPYARGHREARYRKKGTVPRVPPRVSQAPVDAPYVPRWWVQQGGV